MEAWELMVRESVRQTTLADYGDRWLFASRKIRVDGFSPASLVNDAAASSAEGG